MAEDDRDVGGRGDAAYADAAPYFGRVAESYGLAASDTSGNTPAETKEGANA